MKESMNEKIIGTEVANLFIERMKLEGWLPIKEYFKMKKLGIELDWVLVLTMENDGFIAIPMVAEYCVPHKDSGLKPGWYKDDIDNPNRRIDDWTNVIMFKLLDKSYIDGIRDSILDKYKESEDITDTYAYNLSFNEMVIKQCNGIK